MKFWLSSLTVVKTADYDEHEVKKDKKTLDLGRTPRKENPTEKYGRLREELKD
ncbi:MAG: hypothetical protein ACPL5F_09055 [Moorellaceae bacterium]